MHEADVIVFLTSLHSLPTEYIGNEELMITEARHQTGMKIAEILISHYTEITGHFTDA